MSIDISGHFLTICSLFTLITISCRFPGIFSNFALIFRTYQAVFRSFFDHFQSFRQFTGYFPIISRSFLDHTQSFFAYFQTFPIFQSFPDRSRPRSFPVHFRSFPGHFHSITPPEVLELAVFPATDLDVFT